MKKDKHKTKVVFRKFNDGEGDDIIAIFPGIPKSYHSPLDVESYMHVGQHGTCNISCMKEATIKAKPEEYNNLKEELEWIGYNLQVMERMPSYSYLIRNFNRHARLTS